MAKFRKKPVVIEAEKVIDLIRAKNSTMAMPMWAEEAKHDGVLEIYSCTVDVITLEGTMTGELDDWIIRGVKGELYPCKPDIFAATYDPVVDAE